MAYITRYPSPVGELLLTSDGTSLTGLWMDAADPEDGIRQDGLGVFSQTRDWLDAYFRGENPDPGAIPLAPAGTDFQRQVWQLLLAIPMGQTRTYGSIAREIAGRLGKEKMSAQAVGGAVGRNPIGIIIPCHRVVGAQGQLTGYAGGLDKKAWLLRHEGWLKEQIK